MSDASDLDVMFIGSTYDDVEEKWLTWIAEGDEMAYAEKYIRAAVVDTLLAERDAASQRWISVDDQLPDKPQKVLGLYRNQDKFWRYTITIYFSEIGSWSNQVDIRYWLPLPPPPTSA